MSLNWKKKRKKKKITLGRTNLWCLTLTSQLSKCQNRHWKGSQRVWRESKILLVVSREFMWFATHYSMIWVPKFLLSTNQNTMWTGFGVGFPSPACPHFLWKLIRLPHIPPSALVTACKSFTFSCSLCFLSLRGRLTPRGPPSATI